MNKKSLLAKSFLYLVISEIAALVIVMFFPACYQRFGTSMCFVFGICSTGAAACLYADFAWKEGKKAGVIDTRKGVVDNSRFGLAIGAVPTVINYVYVLILWLSKLEIVKYDFYPIYKTLTFYFMPWTYFFAPNSMVDGQSVTTPAAELPWVGMVIITLFPLVFLVSCYISFLIGYKDIDMKSKIIYGK